MKKHLLNAILILAMMPGLSTSAEQIDNKGFLALSNISEKVKIMDDERLAAVAGGVNIQMFLGTGPIPIPPVPIPPAPK